jgi:hypothetical protein
MLKSSFSPAPGCDANEALQRPPWPRRLMSDDAPAHSARLGFSHYVSSRTVLAGGCPAVNGAAIAGARRRSASNSQQ